MPYRTVARETISRTVVQRSIFVAYAREVGDEASVRSFLAAVKAAEPAADHHCYACRLGDRGQFTHCSDAGEPGGTAGRPILGALSAAGVTNAAVVVARYFGGRKLGIPGLIEAYRSAAAEVLREAGAIEREPLVLLETNLPYGRLQALRRILQDHRGKELAVIYGVSVNLRFLLPAAETVPVQEALAGLGLTAAPVTSPPPGDPGLR